LKINIFIALEVPEVYSLSTFLASYFVGVQALSTQTNESLRWRHLWPSIRGGRWSSFLPVRCKIKDWQRRLRMSNGWSELWQKIS